jgi:hypothetical protein
MEINAILGAPLAAFLWVQARRVGIGLDVAAAPPNNKHRLLARVCYQQVILNRITHPINGGDNNSLMASAVFLRHLRPKRSCKMDWI